MKKVIYVLCISLLIVSCKSNKSEPIVKSKLVEVFKASNKNYPNISVHRGGKDIFNYPENCLETIKYINDSISAIFEIDIAQTKDNKLVLMHDNSINRTTTGSGLVRKMTINELLDHNLVDDFGNVTNFKIPLFKDVLKWAQKNNVILTVDIKRSVKQSDVIKAIKMANAEDVCVLITYDVNQAKSAFKQAPDLLLSVSARNHEEFDRLLQANIPLENMIAFTGTRLSPSSLYKRLHDNDIVCMLGTLGNLDRQAKARGDQLYATWKSAGVDIIATDRPFEVANVIN
ncbi:glycerophosphodiester phosphodiesterase family protein [Winogradskyella alexanderae]|uniref:Glycerophosphodiester phosphodiesterase family protein n=1 Tax=Winogradskyella alexanderae TaxID=2877123 RepID=A0ABS7XPH7_9FLAO|nr:glycerophosphodiester phosphodiesterase family protein [Winogradskyella alexanderae]MCA0131922.1 glycerophosphodiester phosphodiesterase family protein [Winogradskyella alexanderae]